MESTFVVGRLEEEKEIRQRIPNTGGDSILGHEAVS